MVRATGQGGPGFPDSGRFLDSGRLSVPQRCGRLEQGRFEPEPGGIPFNAGAKGVPRAQPSVIRPETWRLGEGEDYRRCSLHLPAA